MNWNDETCLRFAEAYDREDAAQRGEADPHADKGGEHCGTAAREATAAMAMREAAALDALEHECTDGDGAFDYHQGYTDGYHSARDQIAKSIRNLSVSADAQAALDRLIAERVREATAELRGLLWLACHEFNAIRARSGAPLDQYGMTTVSEIWWDQLTRAIADAVGPDAKNPWPSNEAKAVTAKIIARGSKEGQS